MLSARSIVITACVAVAACKKGDSAASDSAKAADSAAVAPAPADSARSAAPALTDPNIVAILDAANATDSASGAVAVKKGTDPEVVRFGKMMMGEHHALRQQGQALAKQLNVTPEAPANDQSGAAATAWMDTLNATAKGHDWDHKYIDHEVAYHEAVMQTATSALGAAQNAQLKDLIQKAAPVIQKHIDEAKRIQTKLGNAK